MDIGESSLTPDTGDQTYWNIANGALDLMRRYGCQPSPKAYEVFFAVAAGHEQIMEQVARACKASAPLTTFDLDRIHQDNFRTGDGEWLRQQRTASRVQTSLSTALSAIDDHAKAGDLYDAKLRKAADRIRGTTAGAELTNAVKDIIEDTGSVRLATANMKTSLIETRTLVTQANEDLASAQKASATDLLTGLLGRRGFEAALDTQVNKALKNGIQLILCLAKLDNFGAVNEKFDHQVGDAVLRSVGRIIGRYGSQEDLVGRFRGTTFALVMQGCSMREAISTGEALRIELEKRAFVPKGTEAMVGPITTSIGLGLLQGGDGGGELLKRTQELVQTAEEAGGNNLQYPRSLVL